VSRKRRLAEALAVLLLFTVLVCSCTWPLVSGLSTYLPRHWDPRLAAWTTATNSRQILSNPLLLFHGNSFYPYGSTKAFSEILIVPSLVGMPVFLLPGNPVPSYNITLLLLRSLLACDVLRGPGSAGYLVSLRTSSCVWIAGRCIFPRWEGFCCSSMVDHWTVGLQVIIVAMESLGSDKRKRERTREAPVNPGPSEHLGLANVAPQGMGELWSLVTSPIGRTRSQFQFLHCFLIETASLMNILCGMYSARGNDLLSRWETDINLVRSVISVVVGRGG
jgi:hypothetical protein